jgi:hypothetical protein
MNRLLSRKLYSILFPPFVNSPSHRKMIIFFRQRGFRSDSTCVLIEQYTVKTTITINIDTLIFSAIFAIQNLIGATSRMKDYYVNMGFNSGTFILMSNLIWPLNTFLSDYGKCCGTGTARIRVIWIRSLNVKIKNTLNTNHFIFYKGCML